MYGGAEIHESVLTLLALDRQRVSYQCFAPDISQHHVVNHLTGEEMDQSRNVLVESARIARGEVKVIQALRVDDFDAIILPGGFGAAKNLSDFAFSGADVHVQVDVLASTKAFVEAGKPVRLIKCLSWLDCISHLMPLRTTRCEMRSIKSRLCVSRNLNFSHFLIDKVQAIPFDPDHLDFIENRLEQFFFFMLLGNVPLQEVEGAVILF